MVTEEGRKVFGSLLGAAHRRYEMERARQYDIYKSASAIEHQKREEALARVDLGDRASRALIFESWEQAVGKLTRIYSEFERLAWLEYDGDCVIARRKYGVGE